MNKIKSILPTLAILIFALLLMPLISGCASRTPTGTVAGFFKAIEDGNYNKAGSFISAKMRDEAGDTEEAYKEMAETGDMGDIENPWADEANLECEIDGDTAKVWHKDMDMMKWVLVKEGGQWKIDDFEMDFGAMMEDMGDMMEGMEGMEMPESFGTPD